MGKRNPRVMMPCKNRRFHGAEQLTKKREWNNCSRYNGGCQSEQKIPYQHSSRQECSTIRAVETEPSPYGPVEVSPNYFSLSDPAVLEEVYNDPMICISVGGLDREVRYYGEAAVIMQNRDDPRDLFFESVSRGILIDGVTCVTLETNTAYREVTLSDKQNFSARLGVPGREIFINGRFYRAQFGGPPVEVSIAGRNHWIQLEGPTPNLRVGDRRRIDLVAGKVTLMVDESPDNTFPLFLDAKPQIFEIGGVPFVIKFVDALRIVLINGKPLRMEYGGLPTPIVHGNRRRLLFITGLPDGIVPGLVDIMGMERTDQTTNIVPIVIDPMPPIDTPTFLYRTLW